MAASNKRPHRDPGGGRNAGGGSCPICGTASVTRYRPFCSKRCADIDLGQWLKGVYRIPVDEEPAEGETGPEEGGYREGEGE